MLPEHDVSVKGGVEVFNGYTFSSQYMENGGFRLFPPHGQNKERHVMPLGDWTRSGKACDAFGGLLGSRHGYLGICHTYHGQTGRYGQPHEQPYEQPQSFGLTTED